MKRLPAILLLLIVAVGAPAQNISPYKEVRPLMGPAVWHSWEFGATPDASLLTALRAATTDTGRARTLLRLAVFYLQKPEQASADLDTALLFTRQADSLSGKGSAGREQTGRDQAGHQQALHEQARLLTGLILAGQKATPQLARWWRDAPDSMRIRVLLQQFQQLLFPPGKKTHQPDSAANLAREAMTLSQAAGWQPGISLSHCAFACLAYGLNNYPEGRSQFRRAFDNAIRHADIPGMTEATIELIDYLPTDSLLWPVLEDFEHQVRAYPADSTIRLVWQRHMLQELGGICSALEQAGDWVRCERFLTRVVQFTEEGGYPHSPILGLLINTFVSEGNYTRALSLGLKGVHDIERGTGRQPFDYTIYSMVAFTYRQMNSFAESLSWYQKAYEADVATHPIPDPDLVKATAEAYTLAGRPAEGLTFLQAVPHMDENRIYQHVYETGLGNTYFALEQFDKAEQHYLAGLAIAARIDTVEMLKAIWPLGKLYLRTHRYDKARFYLSKMADSNNLHFIPAFVQRDVFFNLYQADSALGNYLAAIGALNRYRFITDSFFTATKDKQVQELKLAFDTDKKDQALRNTRILRDYFIGGVILLIVVLILLLARYQANRRTNRLLRELNSRQQKLIIEKEWLLKEIHHRVKNNLQVILSLLRTQTRYLTDEYALNAFAAIGQRLQAIALLHQRLYQENGISLISMPEYIRELVTGLDQGSLMPVDFQLEVEPIQLNVVQSVPVGLLINEAITNAIKHAFPEGYGPTPQIAIELHHNDSRGLTLAISDNGIGLPAGFDPEKGATMGIQLMTILSRQLDGEMTVHNGAGLAIHIDFPHDTHGFDDRSIAKA